MTTLWLRRQYGQTLVMVAVAVFLMALMLMATTRMGEHARRQYYLQSVADNAAHSTAVLMARQLNLSAVLNRALIGNQVAMAQWVGLASWLAMIEQAVFNMSIVAGVVPVLNVVMRAIAKVMNTLQRTFDKTVKVLLGFHAGMIKAMSIAQVALEKAMTVDSLVSIKDVVEAHDEDLDWEAFQGGGIAPFPTTWLMKTELHSTRNRNDSNFFKRLVMESRDPFTKGRRYMWGDIGVMGIRKEGGHELQTLANGSWNWNAVDSVATVLKVPSGLGLKWIPVTPIGWGARAAYRKYYGSTSGRHAYNEAFYQNGFVTRMGWAAMHSYQVLAPSFHYLTLRDNNNLGANAVVVSIMDKDSDQFANARAEVHFSRPLDIFPRSDNNGEKANLFNTLWEARLVPLTTVDKASIAVKQELRDG